MRLLAPLFVSLTALSLLGTASLFANTPSSDELATNFVHPPPSARPWVYWFWGNGNITKEGITTDLEAMQRVGLGGVLIMDVGTGPDSKEKVQLMTPDGTVDYNSPQWHEMVKFTVSEAARLGLQVNLTNAPGWAGSGGPWTTPENSQQKLVWTQIQVQGPKHVDQALAQPETLENYYQDIAVLAYPTPDADAVNMADFSPTFSVSEPSPGADPQVLATPDAPGKTPVMLPKPQPGRQPYVQVAFAKPFTARELTVAMMGGTPDRLFEAELQSSDDGVTFKAVRNFSGELRGIDVAFDAVTARYFRLVYKSGDRWMPDKFGVLSFTLSPRARIDDLRHKTLVVRGDAIPRAHYSPLDPGLTVDSSRQVDLSSKMDAQGHLVCDLPAGNWTVLRLGHTSDGIVNHPTSKSGRGLECDKLSRAAADAHFDAMLAKVVKEVGPEVGKTLVMAHIDSWESGTQNWTLKFREEFKKRRGYDLLPYAAALTGMVVDDSETTERFLWDFRQTAAELMADNYAGRLQELCNEHGLLLSIEAYGASDADNGTYGEHADVPMCEFWRKPLDFKGINYDIQPISEGHIWGKKLIPSEAFTSDGDERWMGHPGDIKAMGDWAFAMGINRFVFHRSSLQPYPNIKPGLSVGPFGLHYERTETWWNQSGPWHEYVSRCSYLLQQGLWVADICHLVEERAPVDLHMTIGPGLLGERPGYNYDTTTAEAVKVRFSARDGRIVLPDGMSYRVLTLPEVDTMTPGLLRKIKELVADGATVIGPKPLKSPSLSDHPACDAEIKSIADEVWGNCDGGSVKEHAYGKGRIIWGKSAEEVLREMNVPPDFSYDDSQGGPTLLYAHHVVGDADLYFVANKLKNQAVEGVAHFRVDGKRPEFWHPETGKMEPVAVYTQENGVTSIPMQLDSSESVFVVFRSPEEKADPVASVALDGKPILSSIVEHPTIVIEKATYGPTDDAARTLDVKTKLQAIIDAEHPTQVHVMQIAKTAGDPAPGVTKTLSFDYTVNGKPFSASGTDSQTVPLAAADDGPVERIAMLTADKQGALRLEAWKPGAYEIKTASGQARDVTVSAIPAPLEIPGAWTATFPFQKEDVSFDKPMSWSESAQPDVKYFSGTATYHKTFSIPAEMLGAGKRLYLDLGDVEVNAHVTLNGKDLGLLWKAPYQIEITEAAKAGDNSLELEVTDLWPNRMIGDASLPSDGDRDPDGSLRAWPQWVLDGKPNPTGRQSFTTRPLWKKTDALIPSGLIGPVMLRVSADVAVP